MSPVDTVERRHLRPRFSNRNAKKRTLRISTSDYLTARIVIITLQIAILCGSNPLAEITVMSDSTFGDACYIYVCLRRLHLHKG